ncbi:MAG: hypothetical protein U9R34_01530 [Nanoarchaeota archaeon]|nr:hypothetical protein [Nanoarchaeota archaeon]
MIKMRGDDKEITITYETLYALMRREKNREDIQELDKDFIISVKSYLAKKRSMLHMDHGRQMLFSEEEQKKTLQQITNIIKVLREIYDRRERKIIDLALNKSKTDSDMIDPSKLLKGEKEMYFKIVDVFNLYRATLLCSMIDDTRAKEIVSKIGKPDDKPDAQQCKSDESISPNITKTKVTESKDDKPAKAQQAAALKGNDNDKVNVKFLSQVQKFIDAKLKVHGPFEPGDTAEVPVTIAEVLIKKGSAEVN